MSSKGKRKQVDSTSSDLLEKKSKKPKKIETNEEVETMNTPTEERCEIFVGNLPVEKGLKILKKVFSCVVLTIGIES